LKITKNSQETLFLLERTYNYKVLNKSNKYITLHLSDGSMLQIQKYQSVWDNGVCKDTRVLYNSIIYHVDDIKQNDDELILTLK